MKKLAFTLLAVVLCTSFTAEADERIRAGVLRFQSSAGIEGGFAAAVSDTFAQMLGLSEKFSVMSTEQMMMIATQNTIPLAGNISKETAIQIGKLAKCKYVIAGTVTSFKRTSKNSGIVIVSSHKEETRAEAEIKVYDTETGKEVMSDSAFGRAAQGGNNISIYGVSKGSSNLSGMDAGAISELSSKLTLKVLEKLTGYFPTVTQKEGKEITIDLGTMNGANKGGYYRIYTVSGDEEMNLAVVKVTYATENSCKAVRAEKGMGNISLVEEGDKVFPVNAVELKALKKNGFAQSR